MNISIIGGDSRIAKLAEMYAEEKCNVYTYGLEKYFNYYNKIENNIEEINSKELENNLNKSKQYENIFLCNSLESAVAKSNCIISGMPFTKDNITVNAPFAKEEIKLEKLKSILFAENTNKKFFAGGIPKDYFYEKETKKLENIDLIDLLQIEELTILNAIPTVEGTIKIAIEQREETIHESNVLICGYGRIGKILCDRFSKLGANVYCVARKESDLAWIREKRYTPLIYSELPNFAGKIDIIINTVPYIVLTETQLKLFNNNVLIIDVASNPGGIDKADAQKLGLKVITALGIPGKEMPKTAGKYIKEVVDSKL